LNVRRLLTVAISGGAAFSVVLLLFTALNPHKPPGAQAPAIDSAQTEGLRALANTPPHAPLEDPCRHLHSWVCSKKGITRDPTGFVRPDIDGEKMATKIYEDIIDAHPEWTSDQVNEALVHQIYTPGNIDRIESAHHWVRKAMERIIDSQPYHVFTASEKSILKARLRRTELQMPIPVSNYGDESYLFTKNDVFYERTMDGKLRLRVGGAYFFTAHSWFNQVFTLGHELAHSIDPCELRSVRVSIPAYDRLAACFMDHGLINVQRGRFECGENDQLSETFADWFAVQVTAEALKSFSMEFHGQALLSAAANAVRDLCEQNEPDTVEDTESHPSPKVRISRIFGRNPQIREILGCSNTPVPQIPLAPPPLPTLPELTTDGTGARQPATLPSGAPGTDPSTSKTYCGFDYRPHSM
jgi:hypothetical protein